MNAKEARHKTNEAIERHKQEVDVSAILKEIETAIEREEYQVRLLKATDPKMGSEPKTYITARQMEKLKELYYELGIEAQYLDYETNYWLVVKW
jgi:hypothetical protein